MSSPRIEERCKAYTQGKGAYASFHSGEQCKRKAGENGYCKQHTPKEALPRKRMKGFIPNTLITNEEAHKAYSSMTIPLIEEVAQELRAKYKLKDNTIYCQDDIEFVHEVTKALTQAHQAGIDEAGERFRGFSLAFPDSTVNDALLTFGQEDADYLLALQNNK